MWYSGARQRSASNHGGAMTSHLGLILHVQEGNNDLEAQFNNAKSQSSYTWVAYKDGTLDQFVDSGLRAWGHGTGNATYNSVGSQGFAKEPLTEAACQAIAGLYRWGHDRYGWPYQLAEAPGQPGFGWHGMGGAPWGSHPGCPGDLRKNQRGHILNLAKGAPAPAPDHPAQGAPTRASHAASSTPPAFPGRHLRLAESYVSGADVKTWQMQMANRGWTIEADGVFGPKTDETCRKFQTEKALSVDGIVGPVTWRATWESPVTAG